MLTFMLQCFDIESQRRRDCVDWLAVEPLEDRRLASIVETAEKLISRMKTVNKWKSKLETHSNRMRISFSFCRIFFRTVRNPILISLIS